MIEIKKIIYWHFYIYNQPVDSPDPDVDPADLGDAISTLSIVEDDPDAYVNNAEPKVRAYSLSTGSEWLIDIPVNEEGFTQDIDSDGNRSGIRANNTSAAPGFVWFDISVADLTTLYGTPIVIETLDQMSLVNDGENDGARQNIKYALFAVHKLGESGGSARSKPNAYFSYLDIPQEVVDDPSESYNQLKTAMSPKLFTDSTGKASGFFINIKSNDKVNKLGCCDIVSGSSSSSGTSGSSSSSSGSGSTETSTCTTDSSDTIRGYYATDNKKRIWAVRQTSDVHASNNPIRNSPLDASAILKRRHIFSELVWTDVSSQIATNDASWNGLKWNHAGYIGFRDQLPKAASMHLMPSFNKSDYSVHHSTACLADSYDYNFEMPIAIQSIAFDNRGYLWALCSGGFRDNTPASSTQVSNIETTEGIYRLMPGGWSKKPADILLYGGATSARNLESEELNKAIIADIDYSKMSFGFTTDGLGHYFVAIDLEGHIRLWKQSENISNIFPDDSEFLDDNNSVIVAKYISCGFDKIVAISTDNRIYAWTCNSTDDSNIIAKIATSRTNGLQYAQAVPCKNGIVALKNDGTLELFPKDVVTTSDEMGFSVTDLNSMYTEFIQDNTGQISKLVGGRLFCAILSSGGKVYATGKMGNNVTISYTPAGAIDQTNGLRGNFTFRDATYKNIIAFEDFLIGSKLSGNDTEIRFLSARSANTAYLDHEVVNGIRQFYSKYKGNKIVNSDASIYYDLLESKGLLGIRPKKTDGTAYSVESDEFEVFENSETIFPPIDFTDPDIPFGNAMITKHSLFGWTVECSQDGNFIAVSAPVQEFTGTPGTQWSGTDSSCNGIVYIYHKKSNGYRLFQTIKEAGLFNHFGKFMSFSKCLNSVSGQEVLRLYISASGFSHSTTEGDLFSVYETSNFSDNPSNFAVVYDHRGASSIIPRVSGETGISYAAPSGSPITNWRICSIKSYDHITVICKSLLVSNVFYDTIISIINNSTTANYDNANGGFLHFGDRPTFNNYENLAYGFAGNLLSLPSISLNRSNDTYNLYIGVPSAKQGQDISLTGFYGADNQALISVSPPTSNIESGYIYHFAFTPSGDNFNFERAINTFNLDYYGSFPYRTPSVAASFGSSIDCDNKNIVIGSPTYGTNSNGEINVYRLISNSNDSDILEIDTTSGPYSYNFDFIKSNFSTSVSYPSTVSKRYFGSKVAILNNRILVSASDSDAIIGAAVESKLPGEIFVLESNSVGDWVVVGSNSIGYVGDRYAKSFAAYSTSGGGIDIVIGASGYVGSTGAVGTSSPAPSDYAEGIIKILSIPGGSAYGCIPSKKINKILDPNSEVVENYFYDNAVLGKRHFAGFLTNDVSNRCVWDYSFAQLAERSVIDLQSGVVVPKFKIAKFPLDPVTSEPQISTYSDLGAFSMEQDIVPSGSPGATDISVAEMPIYVGEDKTIRVMEMHPKPFRDLDISADSIEVVDDASSKLPDQVDETTGSTYLTPINSGAFNLFAPIISPTGGGDWEVGSIELSKSFAISPVRSNRWTVPVESFVPFVYDLYNNKLAIYSNQVGFRYISKDGFTILNDTSEDSSFTLYTPLVGNPIKNIKNILITGNAAEFWWSSGNYISPGCIQVVDSGYHGPCAIGNYYPAAANTCNVVNNNFRTITKLGEDINPTNHPASNGQIYNYPTNSRLDIKHTVDYRDFASYRMASGGININWDANILNLGGNSDPAYVTATSKFLGWSGCTIGCAPDIKKDNGQASQSDREKDNYDYADLFNGAVSISGPPVILKTPCFGEIRFTFNANATNCPTPQTIYSGAQYAGNNDKTSSIYGWNACLYFKGKKDSFIHGVHDQHRQLSSNLDPIADRRSQMITYFSGFGSGNQKIYNNSTGSNFPHVLLPSLRFSCLLDKRLSTIDVIRKNFSNNISYNASTYVFNDAVYQSWVSSPRDESTQGTIVGNGVEKPNRMIAPTDTVFLTDLFFNHYGTGNYTTLRAYINNLVKTNFTFASETSPIFRINQTHYTASLSLSYKFGPSASSADGKVISRIYSIPTTATTTTNDNFLPLLTSLTLSKNVQWGTSGGTSASVSFDIVKDLDLFSGYERFGSASVPSNGGVPQVVSFQTVFTTIKTPTGAFANVFKTTPYAVNEEYRNVLRYPYKTSILTGRGRCVQISPLNSEKRSIGRDEIVYQNEFIYRRIRYFFPRTTKNSTNTFHNCGSIRFSRNAQGGSISIAGWNDYPDDPVLGGGTSGDMNPAFVNAYSVTRARAYCSARPVPNSGTATYFGVIYGGSTSQKYEVYPEVKDTPNPVSLINRSSLVCLPTFSVPYMFEIGPISYRNSFIFAATLMNADPDLDYPQHFGPETEQQSPDYNLISINRSNMGTNLSAWRKIGLNNVNISVTNWFDSAAAFIVACARNKAHIFDINTSVVAIGAGKSMASIAILASVNANAALEGGSVTGGVAVPDPAKLKKSRDWSNGSEIRGGGLMCVTINCMLDAQGRPVQGSFNSTMDISLNGESAVVRDMSGTNPVSENNTVQQNVMRNGLWLQPILGLRARNSDIVHRSNIDNELLNPNSNFAGNTPHYWPGNHVRVNDSAEDSGWLPPCVTSHIPKYVPTGVGMVKVPINRAWLTKLGKHKMLYGKKGSGTSAVQTWYSVIGPFVYCINKDDVPGGLGANPSLVPSPNTYMIKERMSCYNMPSYVWDSRPVVFQRFGIEDSEVNNSSVSIFDFKSLAANQIDAEARQLKSFFINNEISTEISNSGTSPNNVADNYYFDRESLNYDLLPKETDPNNSFAMLGEGTVISFVSSTGEIVPIIYWRDSFYVLSKDSTSTRPSITKYDISCSDQTLLAQVLSNLQNSYSLFRQNSFFNEKDKLVISGNTGSAQESSFIYVIKISLLANGFKFDLINYNAPFGTTLPSGVKNISGLSFGEFASQCNQSWKYSLWMSSDSNVICIGRHRWTPESPDDRYANSWTDVPTSDGNPKAFFVDVLSLDANGNYNKITAPNIIGSNSIASTDNRPIENMCESIWGTRQNDGLWKIHCISGQEPTSNYLGVFAANVPQDSPVMKTKVHVFEAQVQGDSGSDNLIEVNNLLPQGSTGFSDLSYNNLNFWTFVPMSAKNGSCGIAFIGNTLAVSSAGHIIRANSSGGSSWTVTSINGQSAGGIINKMIEVSRVESPYRAYGRTDDGNSIIYANANDIKRLKTVCVPSCLSGSSFGFHNYANKICPVVFSIGGTAQSYLATISNTFDSPLNQVGVFDVNTQLQNECNPAYNYLRAGKTDQSNQRYNPSLRAWLSVFSSADSNFGTAVGMPYQNYTINYLNNTHILVKPPVPSGTIKRIYFAGSEAVPMDVSMSYRDYNVVTENELGTMLQSDWHDIAGVMHWGNNNLYILRSYDYDVVNIPAASPAVSQQEEQWIYKKSYYVDQNGINTLPINGFIKYNMPLIGSVQIDPPSNISSNEIGGSRYGIGITGPKAITVAATANKIITYNGNELSTDFGAVNNNSSFIIPLLKNRLLLGNVKIGILVQDDSSMDSLSNETYDAIRKISLLGTSKSSSRFNANDVFVSNSIHLATSPSPPYMKNYLDIKQSGFSFPKIIDVSGSDHGYSVYVSKLSYMNKSNTIWSKITENLAIYLNPDYGHVFNSDKIWVSRLSYVYGNLDSTHDYASWHFVPNASGQTTSSELSPFLCVCGEDLRKASRSVAKWKPNKNFSVSSQNLICAITGNSSITSKLQDKSLNSSNSSDKLTDLVLVGDITKDHILQARNIIGVNDNVGLLSGIEFSMFNSGANSIIASGGFIHIVDTSAGYDDEKAKFINDFCAKFKGFYTRLKGK